LSRKTEVRFLKKSRLLSLAIAEKYHNVSVLNRLPDWLIWAPACNGTTLGIFTHDPNRQFYGVAAENPAYPRIRFSEIG
jgi:hypothetical protein